MIVASRLIDSLSMQKSRVDRSGLNRRWVVSIQVDFIDTVALDMPLFVFNNLPLIYSAINNQGAPSADITLSVGCNPSLTADVFKVFKTYVIALWFSSLLNFCCCTWAVNYFLHLIGLSYTLFPQFTVFGYCGSVLAGWDRFGSRHDI